MGLWIRFIEIQTLLFYCLLCVCVESEQWKRTNLDTLDGFHDVETQTSRANVDNFKRTTDYFTKNFKNEEQLIRNGRSDLNLNIEAVGSSQSSTNNKDGFALRALYQRSIPDPPIAVNLPTDYNGHVTGRKSAQHESGSIIRRNFSLGHPTSFHENNWKLNGTVGQDILRSFMKPSVKSDRSNIADLITSHAKISPKKMKFANSSEKISKLESIPKGFTLPSSDRKIELLPDKAPSRIFSFFREETSKFAKDRARFNKDDTDSDDGLDFQSNLMESMGSASDDVPIISKLISGTLDKEIEKDNEELFTKRFMTGTNKSTFQSVENLEEAQNFDHDIMLDNYFHTKDNTALRYHPSLPLNVIADLQDPSTEKAALAHELAHDIDGVDVAFDKKIIKPKIYLSKNYTTPKENHHAKKTMVSSHDNETNENKLHFIQIRSPKKTMGKCMDGSPPGYYFRKGFGGGKNKWVVHLHGGAWCYNFKSCMRRQKSILGSTTNPDRKDMRSFFHGLLSKSSSVNPHFFNWNSIVLSYCDGGLFSGNRKDPITGKGNKFFFQGQMILRSMLEDLREKRGLKNAAEVILSGTSAGGLALALQGDFMRNFIPKKAKVRGLIDAGLFLDEVTADAINKPRQQFKALYSLHKPVLNKKCLDSLPKKNKYLCLFPENSIRYLNLPVYLVNSLYDHWQLSYLRDVHCIYNEKRCNTDQHDKVLSFRNQMYNAVNDIKRYKNNTGVFANSCIAHGQVILDYAWSKVKIDHKTLADSFYKWYSDDNIANRRDYFNADCKYPCNGSCPRLLAQQCVFNFKGASEQRRKRDAELC